MAKYLRRSTLCVLSLLFIVDAMAAPARAETWSGGDVFVATGGVATPGIVGGSDVAIGNNSIAGHDAVAASGALMLSNYAQTLGVCVTSGAAPQLKVGAVCGGVDTSGTNPDLTAYTNASGDLAAFEAALAAAPPTQTLAAIDLAAGKSATITAVAGANIIEVPTVTLGNSATLTLAGPATATVVLEITGNLSIGSGAAIVLAGMQPANVIINVGGAIGGWGASSRISGTLIAPGGGCAGMSGVTIDGALVCAGAIAFGTNFKVDYAPATVTVAGVPLGNVQAFALLSLGGGVSVGNVARLSANPSASYLVYDNSGGFIQALSNHLRIDPDFTTGCAFNNAGNKLFTTDFSATRLTIYDNRAPHPIDQTLNPGAKIGANSHVESIVFDHAGNFYVGSPDGQKLLKYSPLTVLVATFAPAIEPGGRGIDWIDLAADQCTIFYTSEGTSIRRFDVCQNQQLPDFVDNLSNNGAAYGIRILPDGTVLLADLGEVIRFDANGNQIQTYNVPGEVGPSGSSYGWFAVALDPDGTSFWAGSQFTGNVYRLDLSSGAVELGPVATGAGAGFLGGICIKGAPTAAQTPSPCLSAKHRRVSCVQP